MASTIHRTYLIGIHPVHSALVAAVVPLFVGALLTDIAYACTYLIQWQVFASWLIVAALVIGAVAMVWAVVALFRRGRRVGRDWIYALVVIAMWIVGFFDALMHAKDAWAMMPEGLVLSAIATVLAIAATWLELSAPRVEVSP